MAAARAERHLVVDAAAVAAAGAELVGETARNAIAERGRFDLCLSGGSTPRAMYRLLAAGAGGPIEWTAVRLFFGDERCVPPSHEQSNYGLAQRELLDAGRITPAAVHRMEGERDPHEAAVAYDRLLAGAFDGPWPRFDLVLLGLGEDAHTASLFPGTAALDERTRRCVANHVPKLDGWRLTLTFPAINAGARVAFLVSGAAKAGAVDQVLHGPRDVARAPAQGVEPVDGELIWIVDNVACGGE